MTFLSFFSFDLISFLEINKSTGLLSNESSSYGCKVLTSWDYLLSHMYLLVVSDSAYDLDVNVDFDSGKFDYFSAGTVKQLSPLMLALIFLIFIILLLSSFPLVSFDLKNSI